MGIATILTLVLILTIVAEAGWAISERRAGRLRVDRWLPAKAVLVLLLDLIALRLFSGIFAGGYMMDTVLMLAIVAVITVATITSLVATISDSLFGSRNPNKKVRFDPKHGYITTDIDNGDVRFANLMDNDHIANYYLSAKSEPGQMLTGQEGIRSDLTPSHEPVPTETENDATPLLADPDRETMWQPERQAAEQQRRQLTFTLRARGRSRGPCRRASPAATCLARSGCSRQPLAARCRSAPLLG